MNVGRKEKRNDDDDGRTDGRTDKRMDRPTNRNERTNQSINIKQIFTVLFIVRKSDIETVYGSTNKLMLTKNLIIKTLIINKIYKN